MFRPDLNAKTVNNYVANFVEFKFFTGMRPSEVAALRWSDVDLQAQHVHVHRAIVQGQEKATTNIARLAAPAFCAAQLGHAVGMLLGTYAKWPDGTHNALEKRRLEAALEQDLSPNWSQDRHRRSGSAGLVSRGKRPLARLK